MLGISSPESLYLRCLREDQSRLQHPREEVKQQMYEMTIWFHIFFIGTLLNRETSDTKTQNWPKPAMYAKVPLEVRGDFQIFNTLIVK